MLAIFCITLVVFAVDVNSECIDKLARCDLLEEIYCYEPYDVYAREACAKRCGFCDDNTSTMKKRSHNEGPDWMDHCWDHNKVRDPFCNLLTTTATTTPKPTTTTTVPPTTTTTTTEAPTTTTEEPTTTTEEPTTTTEEPTTTQEPTTTEEVVCFQEYDLADIANNTNFDVDVQVTYDPDRLNIAIHLNGDRAFCEGVCIQSVLNDSLEERCWAFSYNEMDKCYLYYVHGPLEVLANDNVNVTYLYINRCQYPVPTTKGTTPEPILTTPVVDIDTTTGSNGSGTGPPPLMTTGPPPLMTTAVAGTTAMSLGPDTSSKPGGVTIINQSTYQITGLPSPVNGMCFFNNDTYNLNETWKEGCSYDCECIDTDTNTAKCNDICPHLTDIAPGCAIVQDDGQCCKRVDCTNATAVNATAGPGSPCDNTIDTCDFYDDNACVEAFEPWARAHCSLRCGYCPYNEPCVDRISFCNLYDLDDACINYRGWSRHNCKRSCDLCRK